MINKRGLYAIAMVLFCSFFVISSSWAKPPGHAQKRGNSVDTLVETNYGWVEGYFDSSLNAFVWKSIPYAKPPVGELRWKAPQEPESWEGIRDATEPCEECTQLFTTDQWIRTGMAVGSEDCLYLDIYRPAVPRKNLPVYVWIHGGSNNFGTKQDYNGAVLANKANLIVVTIQYRLGPLGWFTHPSLRNGDPLDDSGNFGTLDTIQAVKWVYENIDAFGGNPKKIAVAGESAGAHNVMNLVISPLASGYFSRAISQSGGMTTDTVADGEGQAQEHITALLAADGLSEVPGGDVEAYLRSKAAGDILEAYYDLFETLPTYDAYRDGHVIPGSVVETIRSGKYNKVPIILGANEYESKAFMPLYGPAVKYVWGFPTPSSMYTWYNLIDVLDGTLSLPAVLPTDTDRDAYEIAGYDGSLNWRAKFVDERARALKVQQNDVYAYLFQWDGWNVDGDNHDYWMGWDGMGSDAENFGFIYGAGHAMEIAFFFGGDTSLWGYAYGPGNHTMGRQALSEAMMAYVGRFANSGNPNGSGNPVWQKWSNKEGHAKDIVFDANDYEVLIGMDYDEVTFEEVTTGWMTEAAGLPTALQSLPYFFQWSSPEPE